jgi:hypothetical protein
MEVADQTQPVMVKREKKVMSIVGFHPLVHYGIPSQLCSAPECTVFASQQDSGLSNMVAAQS